MPSQLTVYKVFIASPNDLEIERNIIVNTIAEYNEIEAIERGIKFLVVRYEDALAEMGRPQELVNKSLKECDYFLLLLHERWGSNPGGNEKNATSGTEEEYFTALDCYENPKFPMKNIACVFKSIVPENLVNPNQQLQRVLEFKKKIELEKKLLYATFFSKDEFKRILWKQLAFWLRSHDNDFDMKQQVQLKHSIVAEETIPFKDTKIEKSKVKKQTDDIIENAWKLAKDGKLTEAEIEFSKALINNPADYELLNYARFLMNIGQLDKSLFMINEALDTKNNKTLNIALAYSCKGTIFEKRGDLNKAEKMYNSSLEMYKSLENEIGIAGAYVNLGYLKKSFDDLIRAEFMFKEALRIFEKLEHKAGISEQYANLGTIMVARGDFDSAKILHTKSLELDIQMDDLYGIACQYASLAILNEHSNNLEQAESMHEESLNIFIKLGRLESVANQYGNLGNVKCDLNKFNEAETLFIKSLEIHQQLGNLRGLASQNGNLGILMEVQGRFNEAEVLYKKSLEMHQKLGSQKGMANQYGNLGNIMKAKGELSGAKIMYEATLKIAQRFDYGEIAEIAKGNLKRLSDEQNKSWFTKMYKRFIS